MFYFQYSGNGNGFNIDAANKKLVVLNDISVKKITHKPDESTLKIDKFLLHKTWGINFIFCNNVFNIYIYLLACRSFNENS